MSLTSYRAAPPRDACLPAFPSGELIGRVFEIVYGEVVSF